MPIDFDVESLRNHVTPEMTQQLAELFQSVDLIPDEEIAAKMPEQLEAFRRQNPGQPEGRSFMAMREKIASLLVFAWMARNYEQKLHGGALQVARILFGLIKSSVLGVLLVWARLRKLERWKSVVLAQLTSLGVLQRQVADLRAAPPRSAIETGPPVRVTTTDATPTVIGRFAVETDGEPHSRTVRIKAIDRLDPTNFLISVVTWTYNIQSGVPNLLLSSASDTVNPLGGSVMLVADSTTNQFIIKVVGDGATADPIDWTIYELATDTRRLPSENPISR